MFVNIHTHKPLAGEESITIRGIHPWDAESVSDGGLMNQHADGADAIGEIGLDFACGVDREAQERVFRMQLRTAERTGLPVVLHCVRAFEPTMKILAEYRLRAVIFHGFIGSAAQVKRAVDAGYYVSFGERSLSSPRSVEAMKRTPLERIFLETDESDTPIGEIYARAARELGIGIDTLCAATHANYERLFAEKRDRYEGMA